MLGAGHTVPNGDPAEPYAANTQLCCALLAPPSIAPDGFETLRFGTRPGVAARPPRRGQTRTASTASASKSASCV